MERNIDNLTSASGRKEFVLYQEGGRLTVGESILAKCYDCMGNYQDGRIDCELKECSLYPFMPYNPNKSKFRAERTEAPCQKLEGEKTVDQEGGQPLYEKDES